MQSVLEGELEPGESIIWNDQPDTLKFILNNSSKSVIAIGTIFLFAGMSIFLLSGFVAHAFFLLMIGVITFTEPVLDYFRSKRMVYAITTRRILIVQAWRTKLVWSSFDQMTSILIRIEDRTGYGNIIFFNESYLGGQRNRKILERSVGFIGIKNVHAVDTLLKQWHRKTALDQSI